MQYPILQYHMVQYHMVQYRVQANLRPGQRPRQRGWGRENSESRQLWWLVGLSFIPLLSLSCPHLSFPFLLVSSLFFRTAAIEYLADYEKTWMLDSFRALDARVLQPAGRPLNEWVFLEVRLMD